MLQLTLKLAQAKCQLNIEIVSDKYQSSSAALTEKMQVYCTISIMHLKNVIM